jgi:hypothetical protein
LSTRALFTEMIGLRSELFRLVDNALGATKHNVRTHNADCIALASHYGFLDGIHVVE